MTSIKWCHVLGHLKQVWRLNLQNTDIGYLDEHMVQVGKMVNLKWLDLSCTRINDEGLRKLLPLQQ